MNEKEHIVALKWSLIDKGSLHPLHDFFGDNCIAVHSLSMEVDDYLSGAYYVRRDYFYTDGLAHKPLRLQEALLIGKLTGHEIIQL